MSIYYEYYDGVAACVGGWSVAWCTVGLSVAWCVGKSDEKGGSVWVKAWTRL